MESSTIASVAIALNPANETLSANAGRMAKLFERYRVRSLSFEWVPFKSTSQDGYVVFTYYSNPKTPAPTNLTDCTTATAYATGPVWRPLTLKINVQQSYDWLYTRTGENVPQGSLNDFGVFYVTTRGSAEAESLAGYIRVHYSYDLRDLVKDTPAPQ